MALNSPKLSNKKQADIANTPFRALRPKHKFNELHAALSALIFVGIGYMVINTFAATTTNIAAVEAEKITPLPASATVIDDAAASGSQALKFARNDSASTSITTSSVGSGITVRARGDSCKGSAKLQVYVDGVSRISANVSTSWADYTGNFSIPAGAHTVRIAFTNDNSSSGCSRNLYVDKVTVFATDSPATTGTIYYVSPDGSDSNTGKSQTSPWKTINKLNSVVFVAGDTILFEGSKTFAGNLFFDINDKGSGVNPITVSSYGTGRAVISAGTKKGIDVYNTAGVKIQNINVVGAGMNSNIEQGINFYTDLGGNVKLDGVTIDGVEVSGFGNNGIAIGGWNGLSGFKNINIKNVVSHDNKKSGIITYGQNYPAHQNIYVGYSKAYNNPGSGAADGSGSGIAVGSTAGGTVEYSTAYNNGAACVANACGVGIWAFESDNVTIQHNESYSNKTGSMSDGDGFDLDNHVTNSVMQYNYSHDNDGAGFLVNQGPNTDTHYNNTVRYNISENDVRKGNHYAAIQLYGRPRNVNIYNNTVFLGPSTTNPYANAFTIVNWSVENQFVSNVSVRNNNFYVTANRPIVNFPTESLRGATNVVFAQNNYYSNGSSPWFYWNNQSIYGLSSWKSVSGQETSGGLSVNPQLVSPGGGGTIGDATKLTSLLTAYKLQSGSPLISKGTNLNTVGINPGPTDFYKTPTPQGAFDIGAHDL